ncbi:hypothetical protein BT69DRAFT_1354056 [Atractiella rhizophila]|nr:hypothetical protein BT69DRAFT_1354056 [Atractiella rhizophila]
MDSASDTSDAVTLVTSPDDHLSIELEEDLDIIPQLKAVKDEREPELDLVLPILPEKEHKQLTNSKHYKNPRMLAEEELLTSRLILNMDFLRFGKIHRRNPTEVAFRITCQNGVWLTFHSIDISVYLQEIGEHYVGDRVIPPKVQIADAVPSGKQLPEETLTGEMPPPLDPEPTNLSKDPSKYRFRSLRNKYCVRLISIPDPERDEDDQIPQSIPIYVRLKHTGTFMFRFKVRVEYAYDFGEGELGPKAASTKGTFTRTYDWNAFFDKGERPPGLNSWETAKDDIEEERKEAGIDIITAPTLQLASIKKEPKEAKAAQPEDGGASGSGNKEDSAAMDVSND